MSITDPGNADGVITVGATHRTSRTPTASPISPAAGRPRRTHEARSGRAGRADREQPAEGEKGPLDGTSQAAPHVSAAAAMLMARYPELNREPRRIKRILCESATDLGRERSSRGRPARHPARTAVGLMSATLEVLQADEGDCLLLHTGDPPRRILIDGGPSGIYRTVLRPHLEALQAADAIEEPLPLDLVIVSHIDADHITGILDLLNEIRESTDRGEEPLATPALLWHNSFEEILDDTNITAKRPPLPAWLRHQASERRRYPAVRSYWPASIKVAGYATSHAHSISPSIHPSRTSSWRHTSSSTPTYS